MDQSSHWWGRERHMGQEMEDNTHTYTHTQPPVQLHPDPQSFPWVWTTRCSLCVWVGVFLTYWVRESNRKKQCRCYNTRRHVLFAAQYAWKQLFCASVLKCLYWQTIFILPRLRSAITNQLPLWVLVVLWWLRQHWVSAITAELTEVPQLVISRAFMCR